MTFGAKDNRGPSIAELQRFIREKTEMIFVLNTGEEIVGHLRWFDEHAFSIVPPGEQPFTILRNAVVGYRQHAGKAGSTASTGPGKEQAKAAGSSATDNASGSETQSQPNGAPVADDMASQNSSAGEG